MGNIRLIVGLSTEKARYEPLSAAVGRGIFELASMSGVRGFDPDVSIYSRRSRQSSAKASVSRNATNAIAQQRRQEYQLQKLTAYERPGVSNAQFKTF